MLKKVLERIFCSKHSRISKFSIVVSFIISVLINFNTACATSSLSSSKVLVVYFSISGNTQQIAEKIQTALGADLVRIEPLKSYPDDYDDLVKQGREEIDNRVLPELKPITVNLSQYDTIIVGSPTWWFTAAPTVISFLKSYDFSDKTVCFFMTNGGESGSGIGDMKAACKGANFGPCIKIRFAYPANGRLETSENEINMWINEIKSQINQFPQDIAK